MTPSCHFPLLPSLFPIASPIFHLHRLFPHLEVPFLGGPLFHPSRPPVGEPGTALVSLPAAVLLTTSGPSRGALGGCRSSFAGPHARRENEEWGCRCSSTNQGQPAYAPTTIPLPTATPRGSPTTSQPAAPPSPPRPPAPADRRLERATRHRAESERERNKEGKGKRENDARPGPVPVHPRPVPAGRGPDFFFQHPQADQSRFSGSWTLATSAAAHPSFGPRSPMSRSARLWRALPHCHHSDSDSLPRCCCRPP